MWRARGFYLKPTDFVENPSFLAKPVDFTKTEAPFCENPLILLKPVDSTDPEIVGSLRKPIFVLKPCLLKKTHQLSTEKPSIYVKTHRFYEKPIDFTDSHCENPSIYVKTHRFYEKPIDFTHSHCENPSILPTPSSVKSITGGVHHPLLFGQIHHGGGPSPPHRQTPSREGGGGGGGGGTKAGKIYHGGVHHGGPLRW